MSWALTSPHDPFSFIFQCILRERLSADLIHLSRPFPPHTAGPLPPSYPGGHPMSGSGHPLPPPPAARSPLSSMTGVTITQRPAPAQNVSSGVTRHLFPGEPVLKGTFPVRLPHFAMLSDISETATPSDTLHSPPSDGNGRTPVFLNGVQLHGGIVCEPGSPLRPRKGWFLTASAPDQTDRLYSEKVCGAWSPGH